MALYPCFEKFSSFRVKKNQNIIPTAIRILLIKTLKITYFCVFCVMFCAQGVGLHYQLSEIQIA